MAGNVYGQIFRLTTFGESHGKAIGGVIDGCPAGLKIDFDQLRYDMGRRRPGQSRLTTSRNEKDEVEFLSGIFENSTTGAPVAFIIHNKDKKSSDYDHLKNTYRPGHADFTWEKKYGIRDHRGGGRSSARETACRVVAGSFAKMLLKEAGIDCRAYVSQIGEVEANPDYSKLDLDSIEESPVRCPDKDTSDVMVYMLDQIKNNGDTVGGIVTCVIRNVPVGLGEPVFDKLDAELAKAMLSINAVKGFDIGSGFKAAQLKGSENNDIFTRRNGRIITKTNFSGGVQGGISNGQDIYFRVAFKPVSTLMSDQQSVDSSGNPVVIKGKGRHDVCVVPRAVPIVEAMAALVLADLFLRNQPARL
ncbi:MAG: chorismate synthase [Bacteroidales bacterium]|nr:chorismate synthase [Bacteroidales bacterium]